MRKSLFLRLLTGLLIIGLVIACILPSTLFTQPETETPAQTRLPTKTAASIPTEEPTNTEIPAAPEVLPPVASTPKFAPFCEPSSANVLTPTPSQCQMPIAEQSSVFCTNKVPYNLILINEGSTYESLNEDIECSDAGRKDGKQMLTCTGPMGFSFELRVCDPACGIPPFQAGTTHCPQNYNYNEFLSCCEQTPHPSDANCVTLSLQIKRCVTDCSAFTSRTACEKNFYACTWDVESKVCLVRK